MSLQIKALILSGNGINGEGATAEACRLAGADEAQIVDLRDLLTDSSPLDDAHLLCLPGGFTDGDDLGAAQVMAHRLGHATTATGERFSERLERFARRRRAIIGIGNGFQLLVKLGLLPKADQERRVTLTFNLSGRFEARWVHLLVDSASPCIFTRGMEHLYLPVRHGEGRLVVGDDETARLIERERLVPFRYAHAETAQPTDEYPHNPNGSWSQAAALCDGTGRIFGLMPHPEAYLHRTNHPRWTREEIPEEGMGVALFRNAIDQLRMEI